ncbi:hypothetical protein ON010_g18612 [Phytophthora cinnamomi]|nr:hypothetical protein ON010_g18612 [Phytophthora cinnamomi]
MSGIDGTTRLDGTLCQSAELAELAVPRQSRKRRRVLLGWMGTLCQSAELAGFTGALRPTDWESRAPETKDGWRHARERRTYGGPSAGTLGDVQPSSRQFPGPELG